MGQVSHQSEITFGNDDRPWSYTESIWHCEDSFEFLKMACNDGYHAIVIADSLVLQPENLKRKDVYIEMQKIENRRMSLDLIYRLLFARDMSELRHHVEGLVGTGKEDDRIGLLMETYAPNLSRRGKNVLQTIATLSTHPGFHGNEERQRLVYHYLIFAVLLTEQPFCDYVRQRSDNEASLREFIENGVGPLLDQLLIGNMHTTRGKNTRVDLVDFVTQARVLYCYHCTPSVDLP